MKGLCIVLLTMFFWSGFLCFSGTTSSVNAFEANQAENFENKETADQSEKVKYSFPPLADFIKTIKSFINSLLELDFDLANFGSRYNFDPELERFARSIEKLEPSARSSGTILALGISAFAGPYIYQGVKFLFNCIVAFFNNLYYVATGEALIDEPIPEHLWDDLFEETIELTVKRKPEEQERPNDYGKTGKTI